MLTFYPLLDIYISLDDVVTIEKYKSVIDESSDENLVNVVKALYVYNQCANNYF